MNSHKPAQGSVGRNYPCPCGSGRKYKHCCATKGQAISKQEDVARAQHRRGLQLESQGREEEAVEAYRLAAALSATLPEANSRLGHILLAKGRVTDASKALRAASKVNSDASERRMDLVRALMIEEKPSEAEKELRLALERDPKSGDGFWLLGRLLTESGRLTEARTAFEKAVVLSPDQGAIYYDLVRTFSLTASDRPLINRMLTLARKPIPNDQRIRLQLGLGKAFDDLKEYDRAMQHFLESNKIKSSMGRFDRAAFAARVDALIARFTPSFIETHANQGNDSQVPLLIIGMPRSGTTLVEQIISNHRDVAGGGELQFWMGHGLLFSKVDDSAIAEFERKTVRDYEIALRRIAPQVPRVTDKNPFNFQWAGLVHLVYPNAIIVHCRRDPIDTCLSILSTYFGGRADFSTDPDDLVFYYRRYSRLMAHWRETLPAKRFIEVDYEALVAEPETIISRLVAACELDWDPACLSPERNERVVRSASKWQARQPINGGSVGRWRRYEPWIGNLLELR